MARQWAKVDFREAWLGLLDRRLKVDQNLLYARKAKNVEFYGGGIGKRAGSAYVTGVRSTTLAGWATGGGFSSGSLAPGHGLVSPINGVPVVFLLQDGSGTLAEVNANNIAGDVLTVDALPFVPPAGAVVFVRKPLPFPITCLFQAIFRDGSTQVLAPMGGSLVELVAPQSTAAPLALPQAAVTSNWTISGGVYPTGPVANVETVHVGDWVHIFRSSPAAVNYVGQVTVINTGVSPPQLTLSPSPTIQPQPGTDVVRFYPYQSNGDCHAMMFANQAYVVTDMPAAVAGPVKYTPAGTIQRLGIVASILALKPTADETIAGPLNGVFGYRMKYRNSLTGAESEPSEWEYTTGILVNKEVVLGSGATPLPHSPDPQVDQKVLYRTDSGGAGVWFKLATLANATTTYTDTTLDAALGTQMRVFLDNPPPLTLGVIATWPQANRLLGIDRALNAVRFSDQPNAADGTLKGESWPSANIVYVSFDDGDIIRGFAAFFDSVLVFKGRSIWRIRGVPPDLIIEPVMYRQDEQGAGTFNQKDILVDQNECMFPSDDGFYQINRMDSTLSSLQAHRLSLAIDDLWGRLNITQRSRVHGVFFRRRRQMRWWAPLDANTYPDTGFTYQMEGTLQGQPHGWSTWEIQDVYSLPVFLTASCVVQGLSDQVWVGNSANDVVRLDAGTADLEPVLSPVSFVYTTAPFAPAGDGIPARGRALDTVVTPLTACVIGVELTTDFQGVGSPFSLLFSTPSSGVSLPIPLPVTFGSMDGIINGVIVQTLGLYHQITFREVGTTTAFYLQNFTYWYQALPPEATLRRGHQGMQS